MTLAKNIKRKLHTYFIDRGFYEYRRGWLKGDCPDCGKHKFGINLSQNRTNCFSCTYHDKPLEVVMQLEYADTISQVYQILNGYESTDFREEEVKPYELKKDTILPDGYVNIKRGDSILAKTAREYVIGRGFDLNEVSRAGWGYGTKDKYLGYLIMPFYTENKLIYFNARRIMGPGPKFNNPDVEDFGLGKNMIMYNVDALYLYRKIFLVESVMNSRTLGDNAVATGGKKVSNYQLNLILRSPVEKVVIGLDEDAFDDAIKLAMKIVHYKKVKIMMFKDSRDINDLGRRKSLILSYKSHYLNYNDLLALKNSI